MARTLTAANSILMMSVAEVFPTPQQLQGYSTDDIFDTESIEPAEIQMGVDGRLSAGYVFVAQPMTYNLQADSLSNDFFDAIKAAQDANGEVYYWQGTVALPSLQKKWTCTNGILTQFPPIPGAGKILKPRKYRVTWESISPAPI